MLVAQQERISSTYLGWYSFQIISSVNTDMFGCKRVTVGKKNVAYKNQDGGANTVRRG